MIVAIANRVTAEVGLHCELRPGGHKKESKFDYNYFITKP